ncbi:hypothetical protein A2U01_0025283, partial [Trifolium medium]|nr:hypothetical protein [Trifolium medium]
GKFLKFSNGRVPQVNQKHVYTLVGKTKDAIVRSNEANVMVPRKLGFRDVDSGDVGMRSKGRVGSDSDDDDNDDIRVPIVSSPTILAVPCN